ncbi:hypothetical protein AVEN_24352-1 [Araneus ventricosus]|uniref:Uncharacterized protein n=1 Tax=Araneus ventricosus TaxID=182803 RepID=A0A4Y2DGL5_ARAVE|nr:hypothetical protein AVEN_24352-1 [Araneus ventricosus]
MERENLRAFRKAPPERFVPVPRQPRTPSIAEVLFRLGLKLCSFLSPIYYFHRPFRFSRSHCAFFGGPFRSFKLERDDASSIYLSDDTPQEHSFKHICRLGISYQPPSVFTRLSDLFPKCFSVSATPVVSSATVPSLSDVNIIG